MQRLRFWFVLLSACLWAEQAAWASSLDDLYRDIIRSDNSGYLPLFVKNRQSPNMLAEDEWLEQVKTVHSQDVEGGVVDLSTDYRQKSILDKSRQAQWLKTVAAVKANQVTPFELRDITGRVKENDPKAIEILAWMFTKGVGVSKDFVEAFYLYKRAAHLKVAHAEENARLIYQAMNDDQRRQIKNNL
jgi:hypothetical protein